MLKTIIITILAYSAINTSLCLYKELLSSYSMGIEWTDLISGGPILWLVFSIFFIIRKLFGKRLATKCKKYKPKMYSKRKIEKIVKKAMKIAQNEDKKYKNYFLITEWLRDSDGNYEGAEDLVPPNRERFQFIRKKFSSIYHNQKELTIAEIKKYMVLVTEAEMKANNNEWYVERYKDAGLMKF